MKNKKFMLLLLATSFVTVIFCNAFLSMITLLTTSPLQTFATKLRTVSQQISATGSIHSQQEAVLHFQIGGKLVYIPFQKGDFVQAGQTIAQLDTFALQKELEAALNSYRLTRDMFDQTKANSQNNVLFGQQRYALEVTTKAGITTGDVENNIINDTVQRIFDENQANLNNAVISVELANNALQLATLTAPFSGIVTAEDVTTPNVTVTPVTSFTIADPTKKIFRADIAASDIDFITVGSSAKIRLDGQTKKIEGRVIAIYPQKITLPSGEQIYEVDIQSDKLSNAVFGQNGSVIIASSEKNKALLVPTWTMLNNTKIWVWNGKTFILKTVMPGKTHGNMTEIVSGLSVNDHVVAMPIVLIKKLYQIL